MTLVGDGGGGGGVIQGGRGGDGGGWRQKRLPVCMLNEDAQYFTENPCAEQG